MQPCVSPSRSLDLWLSASFPCLPLASFANPVLGGSTPASAEFGGQEPGSASEILDFVAKYGVTFPMFEKVDVNGINTHPLWKFLKDQQGEMLGDDIKWNFGKFLVGRDGEVLARYAPPEAAGGEGPPHVDLAIDYRGTGGPGDETIRPVIFAPPPDAAGAAGGAPGTAG